MKLLYYHNYNRKKIEYFLLFFYKDTGKHDLRELKFIIKCTISNLKKNLNGSLFTSTTFFFQNHLLKYYLLIFYVFFLKII